MGTELRRMIRDGAPPSWTPLMRLVAMEIADDARDPSSGVPADGPPWSALPVEGRWDRRGRWRDGLTQRCGVTQRAISDALTGLARAGYEMRQAIGTDRNGRPVFAAKGHAMRFQVPPLTPRPEPSGDTSRDIESTHESAAFSQSTHESATSNGQRSHSDVPKVAPGCDPIPSESPQIDLSPHAESQSPHRAGDEVAGSVEGTRARPDQDHGDIARQQNPDPWALPDDYPRASPRARREPSRAQIDQDATEAERRRQLDALAEWERQQQQPKPATNGTAPSNGRAREGLGRDLIAAIIASPGLSATELQGTVHGTRANVLAELNRLADAGAVARVRDGHKVGFVAAGR